VSGAITWFGIFTLHDCHRYLVFPWIFNGTYHTIYCTMAAKLLPLGLQVTVSQLILGIRYVTLTTRQFLNLIGAQDIQFIAKITSYWVAYSYVLYCHSHSELFVFVYPPCGLFKQSSSATVGVSVSWHKG
jgi:hypothetical protein